MENLLKYSLAESRMENKKLRAIAIYLPQYHPLPENDEWWGKGFTEWTNVAKAKPLFEGHYQPHLPADLGFYDLRLSEAREAQADLARKYGIYGFCYYHYWFNGRRILERPFQEVFESGNPGFPFMLCWANENWTKAWDGLDTEILLEQKYSHEDDLQHIRSLLPYFKDSRYIRIDGKPVFAIYKSTQFPDMKKTISIWRDEAKKEGMELYLCRFESMALEGASYLEDGFDAAVEFQPQIKVAASFQPAKMKTLKDELSLAMLKKSIKFRLMRILSKKKKDADIIDGDVALYGTHVEQALSRYESVDKYKRYRCVMPGWDNSPRRSSNFLVLKDSTPDLFGEWVKKASETFVPYSKDENLFFVNAWNEWAEGNHLEPCHKWGKAYLEKFKENIA